MSVVIESQKRSEFGKKGSKIYRRKGYTPGVYYINGEPAMPILFDSKVITKFLNTSHGLIDLKIEGEKNVRKCVLKEIQRDPVTGNYLHVDFFGVKMGEKIIVTVPLILKGVSLGTKAGGILEHLIRELEIECFPRHLPEKLEIDVSNLEIGDSIHIKDLKFEDLKILDDLDETVVVVEAPRIVVEEELEEAEEITEPELIGEKGEDEEESEED
jgi:large subunit ribosomal protein L25